MLLAEYNDMDAMELEELLTESVKETVEREAGQDLLDLAKEVEDCYGETEQELIDALRATAINNPISEISYILTEEATAIL